MSIARMIRDLRTARGLSQTELARALEKVSGLSITREHISRWERVNVKRGVIPSDFWIKHLATALNTSYAALVSEAKLSRVYRRDFLHLSALTATHGALAGDVVSSIAGRHATTASAASAEFSEQTARYDTFTQQR